MKTQLPKDRSIHTIRSDGGQIKNVLEISKTIKSQTEGKKGKISIELYADEAEFCAEIISCLPRMFKALFIMKKIVFGHEVQMRQQLLDDLEGATRKYTKRVMPQ